MYFSGVVINNKYVATILDICSNGVTCLQQRRHVFETMTSRICNNDVTYLQQWRHIFAVMTSRICSNGVTYFQQWRHVFPTMTYITQIDNNNMCHTICINNFFFYFLCILIFSPQPIKCKSNSLTVYNYIWIIIEQFVEKYSQHISGLR